MNERPLVRYFPHTLTRPLDFDSFYAGFQFSAAMLTIIYIILFFFSHRAHTAQHTSQDKLTDSHEKTLSAVNVFKINLLFYKMHCPWDVIHSI